MSDKNGQRQSDTVREVVEEMGELLHTFPAHNRDNVRLWASRLSTAVEPELETNCERCGSSGPTLCRACAYNSDPYPKPMSRTTLECRALNLRRLEDALAEFAYSNTAHESTIYKLINTAKKSALRAMAERPVHGTPTGDGEKCDHCHDPLDCESCEKPEQWEELHKSLEECHDALDSANERIEELARIANAAQAREGLLRDKLTEANARIEELENVRAAVPLDSLWELMKKGGI